MSFSVKSGSLANSGFYQVFKSIAYKTYTITYDFQLLVGSSCQLVIQDEYGVRLVNTTTISDNLQKTGTISVLGNGNNISAGLIFPTANSSQTIKVNTFIITRNNSNQSTLYDTRVVNGASIISGGLIFDASNNLVTDANSIKVNNVSVVNNNEFENYKINVTNDTVIDTRSYFSGNTTSLQSTRDVVDDYQSHHYYDTNGPNSNNLQYLQLTSNNVYPTNLAAGVNACYYEDASGKYMFSVSTQSIYYTGVSGENLNRLTRRELFNLLQDIDSIESDFATVDGSGFQGFRDVWNNAYFVNKNDKLATGIANRLGMSVASIAQKINGAEDVWSWGNYCSVWRYNLSTKQVISRQISNMNKELDPSGNWLISGAGRGPVTSFGDGKFCVSVPNASTNGIIVFDKDLKPITTAIFSSYDTFGPVNILPTNYRKRGERTFAINNDQYNSLFVKKWNIEDLKNYSYRSIVDNSVIDVHKTSTTGPSGEAIFLYLSSSSQGQYSALEATGSYIHSGIMTPLGDYKWNQARGKVIQYAMHLDNSNTWKLTPVNSFYTCPDEYKSGDKLQIESFNVNPDTGVVQDLKVLYPLIDNRSSVTDISGYESLKSNDLWTETFNGQVYNRTTFSDGSSNTLPITSGIQYLNVNLYDVSGGDSFFAYKASNKLDGYTFYQDLYATPYKRTLDASNQICYRQNDLNMGNIVLLDRSCLFYPSSSPKKYVDLSTNITYSWDDASGAYLNNGLFDPYFDAEARKLINNNGFAKRYMFTPYQLDPSANGISNASRTLADGITTVPANCPFSDISSNVNPLPPPFNTNGFSSNSKNTGQQHIRPGFYFPSGHVFDSTQTYYSRPFELKWIDKRTYITTHSLGATSNVNTNYGKVKDLSGVLVKEFFRLCQTAQGTDANNHAVQILLENDPYTDLSGSDFVPSGHIVFKVKGEVLVNQPIISTLNKDMVANQMVVSTIMANQLNYYGAGIYGKVSLLNDSNNDIHMLGGSSNTNYLPLSDMFYPAEYAATKLKAEIMTILNGGASDLSISSDTLQKLGFGNVDWNTQPSKDPYFNIPFNTTIMDLSGRVLVNCTLKGLNYWHFYTSRYAANTFAGQTVPYINFNGVSSTFVVDPAVNNEIPAPFNRPDGQTTPLTGYEFLECELLKEKIIEYRGRVYSPRGNRMCTARPWCVNPKNMELEHIILSKVDNIEVFGTFFRDYYGLTPDTQFVDNGNNRDEVHGVVTCGDKLIGSGHKMHCRVFTKDVLEGNTLTSISGLKQYPSDSTRKNFAITKFTAAGINQKPNKTFVYGSSQKISHYATAASIGGSNVYIGKYKGKDVFMNFMGSYTNQGGSAGVVFIPIEKGVQYNNFENIRGCVKTQDNSAWILPPGALMTKVNATHRYQGVRLAEAYTADDNNNIKTLWITAILQENYPNETQTAAAGWGASWGGTPLVNDLLFLSGLRNTFILNAVTGQILSKIAGSDIAFNETNFANLLSSTNTYTGRPEVQQIGQVNYSNGELHLLMGSRRLLNNISAPGRNIGAMSLRYNNKLNMPYSTFYSGSGNVDVVFKNTDAITYNNSNFVLLTTFLTTNIYGSILKNYPFIDLSYNLLYHSGITAIAVDMSADKNLSEYNKDLNLNNKFINGGSWFASNKVSFNDIKSRILFLYAGQIPPYKANQTPYLINKYQIQEATMIRNQKLLLSEYNRIKNGSTYPYPDNGYLFGGDSATSATYLGGAGTSNAGYMPVNTLRKLNYLNHNNVLDYNTSFNTYNFNNAAQGVSQIYNQPLGYTDVGFAKPFAGQAGFDSFGNPL